MPHQQFERIVPNAETAVLFIHGIVGTPQHFDVFVPLVPKHYSVCNLLLDGHGKTVKDFSRTSMKKWNRQVDVKVEELLQTHENIVVAAHSMGTLFAIRQAVEHPQRVKALFLLAAPLRVRIKLKNGINSVKTCLGIECNDPIALAAKNAYGIKSEWRFWRYLGWIPRYLELFGEIRRTRPLVPKLTARCEVFQSEKDEVVSLRSCSDLEKNSTVNIHILKHSSHYYYAPKDFAFLQSKFKEFLQ